jgi:hypothetical protein
MKLRHSAALVGWYLMVPPFAGAPKGAPANFDAPYSSWQSIDPFDTADACRADRDRLRKWAKGNTECDSKVGIEHYLCARWIGADCIASDDPRLKKKMK